MRARQIGSIAGNPERARALLGWHVRRVLKDTLRDALD